MECDKMRFIFQHSPLLVHTFFHQCCSTWNVIYWPSTELSIKRWTCVNKQKYSGSRWALNNNITRCTNGLKQLETRCQSESQRQTESFGPSVTHGWATPAKMRRKKFCYGQKNLGQYSSLSLSPTHLSHTTNITLSKIKCERLYFYKEVYSFIIEVVITVDYVPMYIWTLLYTTGTHCSISHQ